MTARAQRPGAPSPLGRWRALLVLGLLAGLLGMHGLAPAGAVHGHDRPEHQTVSVSTVQEGCHGDCGGLPHHADPTCKASTVKGAPALPALVADAVSASVDADAVCTHPGTAPDGARAPPSLAELQLLRI
ncbi:DUF6153 family protein [Streptomyces sp. YU58]|uniref:DUF6153 family protein n=1 Tax=Streptomyces sp. SX92 TaxID=3158972 RepID=UPI0027BB10A8|nr:DUF6153 family protein [Streptomyces coralus]WLW51649.1 DUF6153 family protein [Streptomyces coralus]